MIPLAYYQARVFRILRERHPDVYDDLGSPRMFHLSVSQTMKLSSYRRRKRYLELGDPELEEAERLKNRLRWIFFPAFGAVLIGALLEGILR